MNCFTLKLFKEERHLLHLLWAFFSLQVWLQPIVRFHLGSSAQSSSLAPTKSSVSSYTTSVNLLSAAPLNLLSTSCSLLLASFRPDIRCCCSLQTSKPSQSGLTEASSSKHQTHSVLISPDLLHPGPEAQTVDSRLPSTDPPPDSVTLSGNQATLMF